MFFTMKKSLFYLFALICSMGLFTACGDDDPDYTQVIETEIAGDYKGDLNINVDGMPLGSSQQKITIEKAGATAINLYIKNFSFVGISVGDVKLLNCPLSEGSNGAYTFTGNTTVTATGLSATVDVSEATVNNGRLSLELAIKATLGTVNQDVTVIVNGSKLNGTEKTDADIITFTFDNTDVVTEQPVINADNTITFKVAEDAVITALVPTITVSERATVTPASGVAQDFSNGKVVTYTVVSEDYSTTKVYRASVSGSQNVLSFTFENWGTKDLGESIEPYNYPDENGLATPNEGAQLLNSKTNPVGYPVVIEEQGYEGKAAKLVTRDARGTMASMIGAYITAGSLFTGSFEYDMFAALAPGGALKMTHFGVVYEKKPLRFKGVYKYEPGSPFIRTTEKGATETEEVDECAIQAVLYTITSEDETLDGSNIDSEDDERIVARARLEDGTAKSAWTEFNLDFKWKEGVAYDVEKTYKLAIICSSSKDGASFNGASNSTLTVDNLEIIGE